jgi:hypothetical protein
MYKYILYGYLIIDKIFKNLNKNIPDTYVINTGYANFRSHVWSYMIVGYYRKPHSLDQLFEFAQPPTMHYS